MFNISPAPAALAKRANKAFSSPRSCSALAPTARLAFQRLEPTVVIGHVGPVHRAQRHPHRFRNRRLRHSALAQQHHLNTLALLGMSFPTQRCFQTSDLAFGALTICSSDQIVRANHTPTPECNSLRCSVPCYRKPFDSISYGSGMKSGPPLRSGRLDKIAVAWLYLCPWEHTVWRKRRTGCPSLSIAP